MSTFGKNLLRVAQIRDEYPSVPCDFCEQLKNTKDSKFLRAFSKRKEFNKIVTSLLDETERYIPIEERQEIRFSIAWREDILDIFQLWDYCTCKMLSFKDNVCSVAYNIQVKAAPECIATLKKFELPLIRCVIPCLAILRLGQVKGLNRPAAELTDALKGRIIYLPVDVQANAEVLPKKLLNIDSFVIIVNGQPTYKRKVWFTLIDLRKIHSALFWLKDNH